MNSYWPRELVHTRAIAYRPHMGEEEYLSASVSVQSMCRARIPPVHVSIVVFGFHLPISSESVMMTSQMPTARLGGAPSRDHRRQVTCPHSPPSARGSRLSRTCHPGRGRGVYPGTLRGMTCRYRRRVPIQSLIIIYGSNLQKRATSTDRNPASDSDTPSQIKTSTSIPRELRLQRQSFGPAVFDHDFLSLL